VEQAGDLVALVFAQRRQALSSSDLLQELGARHGWDDTTLLAMVAGYADHQETWWTTPHQPGERPPTFAAFLAEVEAAYLALSLSEAT
jgi:hypothetical protein